MNDTALAEAIRAQAFRLGFDLCRYAAVGEARHADFFDAWVEAGHAGEMDYLARNRDLRRFPRQLAAIAPPFTTIIVLAVAYHPFALPAFIRDDPARGLIASYAWGDEYHDLIRPRLHALDGFIRSQTGRNAYGKALVDSGPVLERDWAQAAGLGFFGKNCCTIHPVLGSWIHLATLLIPEVLPPDSVHGAEQPEPAPVEVLRGLPRRAQVGAWQIPLRTGGTTLGTCGQCTRCLDGCPTDAFVGPFVLDARRCISYWTIETDAPIPRELRPAFGNRIFGCDICQELCPWNRRAATEDLGGEDLRLLAARAAPSLLEGFADETPYWLDEVAFATRFRRSPVRRAGRGGVARSVCVALGNWGSLQAIPALSLALDDGTAGARGHAAWALGQVGRRHGMQRVSALLIARQAIEQDAWVRAEIAAALEE